MKYKSPQPVRDALNLITLIRWVGRCRGSFTIARGNEDNWRVVILYGDSPRRPGTSRELILFDGEHGDISTIVERAAEAIKKSPAWEHWHAKADAGVDKAPATRDAEKLNPGSGRKPRKTGERGDEVVVYDYDIWDDNGGKAKVGN